MNRILPRLPKCLVSQLTSALATFHTTLYATHRQYPRCSQEDGPNPHIREAQPFCPRCVFHPFLFFSGCCGCATSSGSSGPWGPAWNAPVLTPLPGHCLLLLHSELSASPEAFPSLSGQASRPVRHSYMLHFPFTVFTTAILKQLLPHCLTFLLPPMKYVSC